MTEENINTLKTLVDFLNTVTDRLGILADRLESLVQKNDEVFTRIREEYWKKIIEYEVNREIEKSKRSINQ